jgi:hypothetical protein
VTVQRYAQRSALGHGSNRQRNEEERDMSGSEVSQAIGSVTFTMDTAERYTFAQARERLHRDMGRKWGAYALYHAGMGGECTVGGTKVCRDGEFFTITDA